jgi:triosephosphate isomerase
MSTARFPTNGRVEKAVDDQDLRQRIAVSSLARFQAATRHRAYHCPSRLDPGARPVKMRATRNPQKNEGGDMRRKLAAGNWKMNGSLPALAEIAALRDAAQGAAEVVICPPAPLIAPAAARAEGTGVGIGGQDCHAKPSGAHTGDVAAPMLTEAGATWVIVGHSERRADHGETDADVRAKTEAAWDAGLTVILCVGETLEQREAGQTLAVVGAQLDGSVPDAATAGTLVIAYEPVWAIGTGRVPTLDQIAEVHAAMRAQLVARFGTAGDGIRLLYGGSVKASNAAEIFGVPDVDGALVGGASLKAEDFAPIVAALNAA